jgi:UTP--glucose-1-phosphate uridylyltransferase
VHPDCLFRCGSFVELRCTLGVQVTEAHTVVLAAPKGPLVKLDDKHYKLVDKMDALTDAVPSLLHANSLTVKGPVRFVAGTSIEGDVLISNGTSAPLDSFLQSSVQLA